MIRVAKENFQTSIQEYQEIYDKNKDNLPYAPKDVEAMFPGLSSDTKRAALRRVLSTDKSDAATHIRKLFTAVDRGRSSDQSDDFWTKIENAFPEESLSKRKAYLVDLLTLWVLPTPDAWDAIDVEELQGYSPMMTEIVSLYPNGNEDAYDDIYFKYLDKLNSLKDRPTKYEEAKYDLEAGSAFIDLIDAIESKDYSRMWDAAKRIDPRTLVQTDIVLHALRLFYEP